MARRAVCIEKETENSRLASHSTHKTQARGRAREVTTNSHVRAADCVRRLDVWEVEGEGVGAWWCGGNVMFVFLSVGRCL
jgi:hypothetical protein